MEVGSAQIDITPRLGMPMGGYWGRSGCATEIGDSLYARAVVFQAGARCCALVSLDLIAVSAETVAQIRAQIAARVDISPDAVMICSSHTHSGPLTLAYRGMGDVDEGYLADVISAAAESVENAFAMRKEARLYYALPRAEIGQNRRSSRGPVIRHAHVLWCEGEDGCVATLFQYACHPVVLGAENLKISGDFAGEAARLIERDAGGTAHFFNGACGDINPFQTNAEESAVRIVGGELASAVLAARAGAQELSNEQINWHLLTVKLPLLPLESLRKKSLVLALKLFGRAMLKRRDRGALNAARARLDWALDARSAQANDSQAFSIQGIAIGPVVFMGFEGELFARYQRDMEAVYPEVVVCGFANGCIGYVPTADEYERGGYEIDEAYKVYPGTRGIGPESEDIIRAAAEDILSYLRDKPANWP